MCSMIEWSLMLHLIAYTHLQHFTTYSIGKLFLSIIEIVKIINDVSVKFIKRIFNWKLLIGTISVKPQYKY